MTTQIQRLVFFKPSRWISRHSLHHNLVWNVMWALFSFTFFFNSCLVKLPILSILVIHFVIINFFCFSFLLKVVVLFSLMDFCLPCVTRWFQFNFKFLLKACCQANKQMETGEKIIHALQLGEKYFFSNIDANEYKHCCSP